MSRARDSGGSFERPYNLKLGPIALTAGLNFATEFVDNVNLSAEKKEGDVILRPGLGIAAVWQVTRLNSLELQTTLGYTKYVSHPELDAQSVLISPDSALRLNIFVGDVKIVLHEQFSFQEDPAGEGGVSGVATFGRFVNTIGANALWDLNDVIWSLGYDHYNLITTGNTGTTNGSSNANLSALDRSTDQISSSLFFKLGPTAGLGVEGTAAYSKYPKNSRADSSTFSLGPFIDYQLTRYTRLLLSGGYQTYASQNGGDSGAPPGFLGSTGIAGINGFGVSLPTSSNSRSRSNGDGSGYYVNLSITHRLNSRYSDRLALGREFQIGLLSDRTETTFINYAAQWQLGHRITISGGLSYEMVKETSQFSSAFGGATLPDYDRITALLSTSYQLTRKLSVGINYQFEKKLTDLATQDYTQNRLAVQFGYQF